MSNEEKRILDLELAVELINSLKAKINECEQMEEIEKSNLDDEYYHINKNIRLAKLKIKKLKKYVSEERNSYKICKESLKEKQKIIKINKRLVSYTKYNIAILNIANKLNLKINPFNYVYSEKSHDIIITEKKCEDYMELLLEILKDGLEELESSKIFAGWDKETLELIKNDINKHKKQIMQKQIILLNNIIRKIMNNLYYMLGYNEELNNSINKNKILIKQIRSNIGKEIDVTKYM